MDSICPTPFFMLPCAENETIMRTEHRSATVLGRHENQKIHKTEVS